MTHRTPLREWIAGYKDNVIAEVLAREPANAHLYHYTSVQVLISIADKKELWATNIRYMNDGEEMLHALEIARRQTENFGVNNNQFERTEDEIATITQLAKHAGGLGAASVFTASFSEDGDELSQWRGYCPSGGFAVGVPWGVGDPQLEYRLGAFGLTPYVPIKLLDKASPRLAVPGAITSRLAQWSRRAV